MAREQHNTKKILIVRELCMFSNVYVVKYGERGGFVMTTERWKGHYDEVNRQCCTDDGVARRTRSWMPVSLTY